MPCYDNAVIEAGILGLAQAYHLAHRGRKVFLLERYVRLRKNFGMLWPVGQPSGVKRDIAIRSVKCWLEVLSSAGL